VTVIDRLAALEFKAGKRVGLRFGDDDEAVYPARVSQVEAGEIRLSGLAADHWVVPGCICLMEWEMAEGSAMALTTVKELRDGNLGLLPPTRLQHMGRRQSQRLEEPIPVQICEGSQGCRAFLLNLSKTGCLLQAERVLLVGETLRLRLQLPGGSSAMTVGVTARVAWTGDSPTGRNRLAGLNFTVLPAQMRDQIDRYVLRRLRERLLTGM